ncbi:Endoglucanase 1 [Hibiscus syriacus]|uniref:Endoglucanase n=1 Tax=Hibiscus syriacus TaxID=106335 RepID=A0A6A2WAQ0_HIBSY|nr:Endoglucanase 1 [Hibiscus syriacus]
MVAAMTIMQILCLTLFSLTLLSTAFTSRDYSDALEKSILFFEGQWLCRLLSNQHLKWRGNSGLSDGASYDVDLVGGYYDSGDNVKFGLQMAFTITMLSCSVIEFGSSMQSQIGDAKTAIHWGTDYLLKAATATPATLYVGDPNMDHKCWERPEDMDTPRNVYKVSAENPGSDVVAETVAALAAASILFDFADRHRGSYNDSLNSVVCPFYCFYSGYQHHGCIEPRRITPIYLSYIQSNGHTMGSDNDDFYFSWDDKRAGTKVLLSKAQYTPGGLLYKASESNLQYVATTSFLLLTYAKYLNANGGVVTCGASTVTAESLIAQAKKGSSVPSIQAHPGRITCDNVFQYLYATSPNPNVLVGAVIGGPDSRDNFADDRNNYQQSEPATYINAQFVGVLAFFAGIGTAN